MADKIHDTVAAETRARALRLRLPADWEMETMRRTLSLNFQPVVSELHTRGQFRLRHIVIVIMCQMRKKTAACADAPGCGQGLIQAHVCWMRRPAQGIQNNVLRAANFFHCLGWNFFAITHVCQALLAVLLK